MGVGAEDGGADAVGMDADSGAEADVDTEVCADGGASAAADVEAATVAVKSSAACPLTTDAKISEATAAVDWPLGNRERGRRFSACSVAFVLYVGRFCRGSASLTSIGSWCSSLLSTSGCVVRTWNRGCACDAAVAALVRGEAEDIGRNGCCCCAR